MVALLLAAKTSRSAGDISRSQEAGGGPTANLETSAAGHELGSRGPEATTGRGGARRAFSLARRRLFRELCRLRAGDHCTQAQDHSANERRAGLWLQEALDPRRPICGAVCEAAFLADGNTRQKNA